MANYSLSLDSSGPYMDVASYLGTITAFALSPDNERFIIQTSSNITLIGNVSPFALAI